MPPSALKFEKLCLRKLVTSSPFILTGKNAHVFAHSTSERLGQKRRVDPMTFSCRKNGKVFVRSGAGIVADSVPANEYRECINKAKAVTEAIRTAARGLE